MQVVLDHTDRVLLVDDRARRGSQARAVRHLVHRCGARFLGVCLMVDQLDAPARAGLGRITTLVTGAELPPYAPPDTQDHDPPDRQHRLSLDPSFHTVEAWPGSAPPESTI
jgi:hypothetical protein